MLNSTLKSKIEGQTILKESETCLIDKDDLYKYANYLGLNLREEVNLLWIVAKGLLTSLPPNWLPIEDAKGRVYYFNRSDGSSTWIHPADVESQLSLRKARDDPESVRREKESFQEYSERHFPDLFPIMTEFQKICLSLPDQRSVRFNLTRTEEISYESESSETADMDDLVNKFGLMDAESLSPAFIRSPEPEDVNSLLRLTSLEPPSKMPFRSAGKSSSPLPSMDTSLGDKRFLKPLSKTMSKLPLKNESSVVSSILKPADKIHNIDVLMDSTILSHAEFPSRSNSPLPSSLAKLSFDRTPMITKTPPPSMASGFSLSQEELKLKVDHEMALMDLKNKFEDEREMEEEKLRQEALEFKLHLENELVREKEKLQSQFDNDIDQARLDLEKWKKNQLKEIEDLKEDFEKKRLEELKELETKLRNEKEKTTEMMEKEFDAEKMEQKKQREKEMIDTKKKYTIEMAKMKLDLEKELRKKTLELQKEQEQEIKKIWEEEETIKERTRAEIQNTLEEWKKSEEAKLIQKEATEIEDKVQRKNEELDHLNQQISQLTEKKEKLEQETRQLEIRIKTNQETATKSEQNYSEQAGNYSEPAGYSKPDRNYSEPAGTSKPVGNYSELTRNYSEATRNFSAPTGTSKPAENYSELARNYSEPTTNYSEPAGTSKPFGNDCKQEQFVKSALGDSTTNSGREDIEYLHQKVLRVDSYLQTFNEQLQSLSQVVASRQYQVAPHIPRIIPAPYSGEVDSASSSDGIDTQTFTREEAEATANHGTRDQPIHDEFSRLKEILKTCQRKLRSLERRRFDVHATDVLQFEYANEDDEHSRFNSYNSYWNENLRRKKASVERAQRLLGIHSKPKKQLSRLYRYDQESRALTKMAEKLTKKLDREARELNKIEAKWGGRSRTAPLEEDSHSFDSSSPPSGIDEPTSLNFQPEIDKGWSGPYIPYEPVVNVRTERNLPVLTRDPFSIENKIKEAWSECFSQNFTDLNHHQPSGAGESLRTDHAKWMEKIERMNRKIRQTNSKSK